MMKQSLAMHSFRSVLACIAIGIVGCSSGPSASSGHDAPNADVPNDQQPRLTEGTDYVVLERRRFLDEQGFDRPVEAFSVLCPMSWRSEGGVQWKGIGGCRGEMIATSIRITSPDGAIRFEQLPARSFSYASDPMMMQAMQAGAQAGGCGINQPFTAEQYIEGFARQDLKATASGIVVDEARMPLARKLDEQANATAMQFGNPQQQSTTFAKGRLSWPDGTQGIIEAGVTNLVNQQPDLMTGGTTMFSSTSVFYTTVTRFPPERKDEAARMLALFTSSHRMNPVWTKARDDFFTRLGNIEHAGRMERIRLMGEQAQAYAKAQSDASDQRMRSWEQQQASNDRQHEQFVKSIREVETWSDGSNGRVELTSGYDHAWSRGDGSYILSNNPNFDPSSAFQDQQWKPMVMDR